VEVHGEASGHGEDIINLTVVPYLSPLLGATPGHAFDKEVIGP